VIDVQGLGRSQFAASRAVLAKQICELEAATHETEKEAETQERITETEAREGETVDEHIVPPKPMFFLKTSSDPQGDAIRDAIHALLDVADSLEKQHLPLRAAFIRDQAKHMRIDLLQGLRDNYGNYSGGLGLSRDPNACNLAADLQEKLKRLPTLKPRTGRRVELDEECYLLGKPKGLQDAKSVNSGNPTNVNQRRGWFDGSRSWISR
jgi:hypothetical protein